MGNRGGGLEHGGGYVKGGEMVGGCVVVVVVWYGVLCVSRNGSHLLENSFTHSF